MAGALPLLQTVAVFILQEAFFPSTELTAVSRHGLPGLPAIRDAPAAV